MKPGYVFWTVVSVGVLILVFGVVLHGVPRSPPTLRAGSGCSMGLPSPSADSCSSP